MGKEEALKFDKWGYPVNTTSNHCISAINDFYEQVLNYGRKRSIILDAPVHDESCVLGNTLAAHFSFSSHPSEALSFLQSAKSHYDEATVYEKAVFDAVSCIISDDTDDDVALEFHFKLLRDFPKDLSSLKRAQILCFYMGQPNPSLDLVQQVLPENEEEAYIYGMLSFPLLELGQMEEAERAARKALEINKQDVWAQHCLCHVLQHECRFAEAVQFMEDCSPSWSSCSSFMYTHNWWHVALCYLEGHSPVAKVLDVYDHCIMREIDRTDATRPEVYLNALGLLLRLHIRGQISLFEDRLKNLAELLTDKSLWYLEWQLDLFILWALTNTDKLPAAQELLKGLKLRVSNMSDKKQQQFQRGLSLAETIYEYGRGKDERALQLLGSDFDACDYKAIGASDEQIDVFNEVWYILLLNTGKAVKVIDAIEKRLKMRDGVPFLWRLLERAYSMMGREEAVRAADKANHLERIYFQ
ncbi:tetratricopeptide repeat protein 38-like [Chenopodium quinoa]|uniref:tetratricopeptide repeat protein 38-like n=1 Tax=Chenopodium quinoa TaxID=63459 RepID=UPI000B79AA98|nr:tetratricopeptide repeat protein 38-like [Chenopodium quinoa]